MDKKKILAITFIAFVAILIVWSAIWKNSVRKEPQVFTVGTVIRTGKSTSGGFYADYEYEINGKRFNNTTPLGYYQGTVQRYDKFLVSVPTFHNAEGLILFDCKFPDAPKPPTEGWSVKPNICSGTGR